MFWAGVLYRILCKVNIKEWRQIQIDKNVSLIHGYLIFQGQIISKNGLHRWQAEIFSFLMVYYTKGILKV